MGVQWEWGTCVVWEWFPDTPINFVSQTIDIVFLVGCAQEELDSPLGNMGLTTQENVLEYPFVHFAITVLKRWLCDWFLYHSYKNEGNSEAQPYS